MTALVATFSSALADPICKPETLHYKPRMISVAERDGFAATINEVCGNSIEKSVQRQFESTIFRRICTGDTFSEDECIANLQSIVEACVASKNTGGGILVTNTLTVEVHLDSSNNETRDLRAAEERRTSKPKPSKPKPVPAKPTPAKPTPARPTPATPKPVKTPPAGKACKPKPGKGKGTGNGKSNEGKKSPTKVVRDLISKLLRRAGSSGRPSTDYGSGCDPEEMTEDGGWGMDTWRSMRLLTDSTITNTALRAIAKSGFDEVMSKKKGPGGTVVAALFVPGQGVFLGTPAHGAGPAKVESFAEANAPFYWVDAKVKDRTVTGGAKYHAEDIAMLYAIEANAAKGDAEFPKGSKIATWGKVNSMPRDDKMKPCSQSKINPTCTKVIKDMGIVSAYDDKN